MITIDNNMYELNTFTIPFVTNPCSMMQQLSDIICIYMYWVNSIIQASFRLNFISSTFSINAIFYVFQYFEILI